jgi:5'-3' exonuclease
MGVKGLYTYLRPYRHDIYVTSSAPLPEKNRLRIGVDAMSILYKYKSSYKDIYPLLSCLKGQGHRIIFVFDGKPPAAKEEEVKERREARQAAGAQASALKEYLATDPAAAALPPTSRERQILEFSVARLEFQGWNMSRTIRKEFQEKLKEMEIPFVKADGEADGVLNDLVGAGKLDVIISTDMDFLLTGAPRLWIPTRKGGDGFEEIVLAELLDGEGITQAGLLDAGILCGVEPLRGELTVLPPAAFSWMRYYKGMDALLLSAVQDPVLDAMRDEEKLERARRHFAAATPWWARIRADHYEAVKPFLESL